MAHKFEGVDRGSTKRKHGEGGRLATALESSADPEGFFAGLTQEQQRSLLLHREWEQVRYPFSSPLLSFLVP